MDIPNKLGLLLVIFLLPGTSIGKNPEPPVVSMQGDTLKFEGQYVHIQGQMPSKANAWFYHVEREGDHLFDYTFWTIEVFKDTQEDTYGLYQAKSWHVQVLDSKDNPEKSVIFDRLSDFSFWGYLVVTRSEAKLTIKSVQGMPGSTYGPVALKLLKPVQVP